MIIFSKRISNLKKLALVFCLLLLVAGISFLYKNEISNRQITCKGCNVILVAIDSLSAEHLPCYGYYRNTSPNLCNFASNNIFFKNAYANSSWTLPSDISLFTGKFPIHTGVFSYSDKLNTNLVLMPKYLQDYGYSSMFFAPSNDVAFRLDNQYSQIEDIFYNDYDYNWLYSIYKFQQSVRSGKKTFMYLHTYDVHGPFLIGNRPQIYEPVNTKLPLTEEEFDRSFKFTPEFAKRVIDDGENHFNENPSWVDKSTLTHKYLMELKNAYPNFEKEKLVLKKMWSNDLLLYNYQYEENYTDRIDKNNPNDIASLRALYDQKINIFDQEKIPLLTDLVNTDEFRNNTILIFYSEHGEEFMEHGHLTHETIYNPNVKIPLIMYIPNTEKKVITEPVQLADIAPTLDQILQIPRSEHYDGRSLVNRILGIDKSNELINIDGYDFAMKALIFGKWKLHVSNDKGILTPFELYDLSRDPGEKNNILFANQGVKNKILRNYSEVIKGSNKATPGRNLSQVH